MYLKYELAILIGLKLEEVEKKEVSVSYFNNAVYENIANNTYLTNKFLGLGFVFDEDTYLVAIHLHGNTDEGYNVFKEELPLKIAFEDRREEVKAKVGLHDYESGEGEKVPILGWTDPWIKYNFDNASLHFSFGSKKTVRLVTIGKLD